MKKNLKNIRSTGFKVPKDYFENFEETLLGEIKLKETIHKSGFKTPESYFETIDDTVLKSIETNSKVKQLIPWKQLTYISGIAASILIIINLYLKNSKNQVSFDSLETASITHYLTEEEFNAYELAGLFSEEELTSDKFIEEPIKESALEAYLYENASIEDLITE
ncbi:hypothetical protein [Litoribaculum gwangyangense]|uniref:Uncharacterized protein n=1 Tax=Litoribaculum gwangyangense TaxID=1130722 RepID=A0ABP9CRU3_9FLAO